jgi:hypothetical protein
MTTTVTSSRNCFCSFLKGGTRMALGIGIVVVALAGARASGATLGAYIYGIDDNSDIYEINPADQTWEKVYSSARASTTTNLDGPDSLAG